MAYSVDPAALGRVVAHSGTTHAGTPHWLLGALTLAGVAVAVGGWVALRGDDYPGRLGAAALGIGAVVTLAGLIGLVEIQIAPQSTPDWTRWFPVVNTVAAIVVALGSLVVVRWKWPERPRYVALGFLLACWIGYPAMMPNEGLSHPFGYLLVLGVPLAVAAVLSLDGNDVFRTALADARSKAVSLVAFAMFAVFFAVSAGTMSINPDVTPEIAGEGFVTTQQVAGPLVYWPAVEFYWPAVPLAGYVSPGTVVLVALLGGLVALNAGLVARQLAAGGATDSPRAMFGTLAASGATACCCCAPALYGAVGVLFGAAATPVYWAFMDPTSPVGGIFLAASVVVLTGSAIRASYDPACRLPRDREAAPAAEGTA